VFHYNLHAILKARVVVKVKLQTRSILFAFTTLFRALITLYLMSAKYIFSLLQSSFFLHWWMEKRRCC